MTNRSLGAAVRHIRTLTAGPSLADATDGQLLERFASRHDGTAFAVLLRRHGPMVLGVCRRVLGQFQDAEDAFQATFLLLARKARSIRKQGSVGSWLHGVAHRIAVKAKAQRERRLVYERRAGSMRSVEAGAQAAWKDLEEALDGALQALPERYRVALVMCHLEETRHEEAARELGCPTATLRSRLTRGRKLLRAELTRRGVALSAGAVGVALLANTSEAAMPALLINATAKAALLFAAGATAAGVVSASAAALVEEGGKAVGLTKVKLLAMLLAALSVVGVSVGAIAHQAIAAKPPEDKPADAKPVAASLPRPEDDKQTRLDDYGDPLPPDAVRRVGTLRFRQGGGEVNTLLPSPDGRTLISNTHYGDRRICEWDLATGTLLHSFPGTYDFTQIALSPDGSVLAESHEKNEILLWDVASGKELMRLAYKDCYALAFAFSPDGKTLLSGGVGGFIDFWDLKSGKHTERRETANNRVNLLAFSPDGKTLASGDYLEDTIILWDAASGKEVRRLTRPGVVWTFAFSPDGAFLASTGNKPGSKGSVILWDVGTGKLAHEMPAMESVAGVAFSPDSKTLASAEYGDNVGAIVVRDVSSGKCLRSIDDVGAAVRIAFSADGKTLISGTGGGAIRLWDAATGKERAPGGSQYAFGAALSPDGRTLAFVGESICLWDMAAGRELPSLPKKPESTAPLVFSPDGKTLACRDLEGWALLLDAGSGKALRQIGTDLKWKPHSFLQTVQTVAFSPDGNTLATGGYDGAVRFWDPATGKQRGRVSLKTPEEEPKNPSECFLSANTVAFSPDGRTLVAAGEGNAVTGEFRARLWDIASQEDAPTQLWQNTDTLGGWRGHGRNLAASRTPMGVQIVFSPDGRMLAVDHREKAIPVWEAATGKERLLLTGHQESTCYVAFAPDGRTLASSSFDDTIRLWDLETGDELRTMTGHRGKANSLVFSADGKTLVSTGDDTTLMFWDVDSITHRPKPKAISLSPKECEALWADLAGKDAAKAYRAIRAFATDPTAAAFLGERLRPARTANAGEVDRWIAALDNDDFEERDKATRALGDLGEAAEPALRKAINGQPSAEVRSRADRLLEKLATPAPELLRGLRAVEALEAVGGPEVKMVLERIAKGAAESRLTREANAALGRLGEGH